MNGYDMMGGGGSSMMGGSGNLGNYGIGGSIEGILSSVIWIAVLIGIVFLVIWLVRHAQGGGFFSAAAVTHGGESALDVLKKRYARGEIDRNEYEEKRSILIN